MGIENDKRSNSIEAIEGRGSKVGSEGHNQQGNSAHVATPEQERERNRDLWRGVTVPSAQVVEPSLPQQEQAQRNRDLFHR
ncbi:MAG: hypothetical protein RL518_985 [Pseudomonadota bacterium]